MKKLGKKKLNTKKLIRYLNFVMNFYAGYYSFSNRM